MNDIKDFISNILLGNNVEAKESFNDLLSARAMDVLAERKQQIAQSLFQTEEVESLDEAAKWRSTSVAQKVTDPKSDNPVSMSYHHEYPGSTGMLRATSDTDEKESSLSARRRSQVATQGPRKGMITKRSAESLKNKIKSRLRGEEVEHIDEKAVSQQQQKFMGMVYAAKKGMEPASPEVAKAAASMTKKQAKDYAATKHEGLPEKK